MLRLPFALVSLATSYPTQACDAKISMAWGRTGILSSPKTQLGHMEHDVGKETECETSTMSSGQPTRCDGPAPSFVVRDHAVPSIRISKKPSSKQRMVNIALWAYADSHMGDATSPPCCYSCTHDT